MLGSFSKDLLGSEAFQALQQLFSQQCAADMIATQPHESKKREQIYASHLGFEQFIDLMKKFAKAYDQIENPEQPDYLDIIDDPDVHNIHEID